MILIEKTEVVGLEPTIRGMRNPMNSWDKSDSLFVGDDGDYYTICGDSGPWPDETYVDTVIGKADHELMMKLAKGGSVHGKFRRMITVYVDITAPLYWWKEFDTYKVGTVANSCSTMHKIHAKEFVLDDFSHEHLLDVEFASEGDLSCASCEDVFISSKLILLGSIEVLNHYRNLYLETNDKKYWWQMIQLLPSSYNQKRTVMLNYEVLSGIYKYRYDHKQDEWRTLCGWIEELPYSEIITVHG